MKNLLISLFLLITTQAFSQKWIDDSNFDDKINQKHAFTDGDFNIVVVEFWADFNKDNAFKEWNQLKGTEYFRVDISKAPNAKKEYRIRMAPTIIIFKDGIKEEMFKASLDLECPIDLEELQEAIEDIKKADRF
jgi:hypothetical protein|tara:strand:- start:956 stop:1357 length:402 start_codon:yes stop_codon:yes gene_type:complete